MSRILIEVRGGVITQIYSTDPKVQVFLHDRDGDYAGDPSGPVEFNVDQISDPEFNGEFENRKAEFAKRVYEIDEDRRIAGGT